jgi:hypothetical protein
MLEIEIISKTNNGLYFLMEDSPEFEDDMLTKE